MLGPTQIVQFVIWVTNRSTIRNQAIANRR
jgi:hypothetical protein